MGLTQRRMNHVYFWDSIAWALAVLFIILQPVICVHSQWVTAPIFWSLFAFSITVQLCVILVCSLPLSSTLLPWTPALALVYKRVNGANPTSPQIRMHFLSSGRPSSPAHRVVPKGSPLWESQPTSVLCPAKGVATGNTFFSEIYSWQQHHGDRGANKCCILGALTVSLSANLSDHVWFAACVFA